MKIKVKCNFLCYCINARVCVERAKINIIEKLVQKFH